jgi:glycosyltransferase involved in cell wall biosynthesis
VTILIATIGARTELLLDRALPSALAQTHANIEVLVVGDASGEDLRHSLDALGDPRVRCLDLTQRYVHPNPQRHWLNGSTVPRNEGYGAARGRWISELDDDDALRPGAIAGLLARARERRLEVAYGIMEQHDRSGDTIQLGRFPPASADPQWREHGREYEPWDGTAAAAALVHAGLRFFAREHVAAEIPAAGDYFRLERMVRAGVRFGLLPEVVYDYYPSNLWGPSP